LPSADYLYPLFDSVDHLMATGVTEETPAEWLYSECERFLLDNYNAAVALL
jgi:hypothetical protein